MDSLELFLSYSVVRPYSVSDVRPRIVCKDVEINRKNVKQISKSMPYAQVFDGSDEIVVYNYRISKKLGVGRHDALARAVRETRWERTATIAHETKHVQNNYVFSDIWSLVSPYDRAMVLAMDEVSAYAAEKIKTGATPCRDDVWDALRYALDQMVKMCRVAYIPEHMKYVTELVDANNMRAMLNQEPVVYSAKCRRIVDAFLTYGDVCVSDGTSAIPDDIMKKWRELLDIYEQETRQRIKSMVSRYRRARVK